MKQNDVKNAPNYLPINRATHPETASAYSNHGDLEEQAIQKVVNESNKIRTQGHLRQSAPLFALIRHSDVGGGEESEPPAHLRKSDTFIYPSDNFRHQHLNQNKDSLPLDLTTRRQSARIQPA